MIRGYEVTLDKYFIGITGKVFLNNPSIENDEDCICWCKLHTTYNSYTFYANCSTDKWAILKAIKKTVGTKVSIDEIMKNICESCDEFADWYDLLK